MKLENVQIEIKNKKHYEAIKKRLQELGKWNWIAPEDVDSYILTENYKAYIDINTPYIGWTTKEYAEDPITLDDLYEAKKEKGIIEKFRVLSSTDNYQDLIECNFESYNSAVDWIKKEGESNKEYEIRKFYEIVEE